MPSIRGNIIRILDKKTVIINLGEEDGITHDSVFKVLGSPEPIVDPSTKEELGTVTVLKTEVKAGSVFPRFTIATSQWVTERHRFSDSTSSELARALALVTEKEIHGGELNVREEDITPWEALSVSPVQVGDTVEVMVDLHDAESQDPQDTDMASATEEPESES